MSSNQPTNVELPSWTLIYHPLSTEGVWTGTNREFFTKETTARYRYSKHVLRGDTPTLRPYHHGTDAQFLFPTHAVAA